MMAAVHRYEGTVNQVTGDGIMVRFGAPIAHEDHAVHACYAALAFRLQHYWCFVDCEAFELTVLSHEVDENAA